jgi:metallophosphoesterase superfamily enzyme
MDRHVYNTLILSDLHLGAETSQARGYSRSERESFRALHIVGRYFC